MMNNSFFNDFKNAWDKPNNAPAQLIIINVVIFIFMAVLNMVSFFAGSDAIFTAIYNQFSIPPLFKDFIQRPWTIITYAFAHSLRDILHILFNMLVFYWFSRLIVEFLGNKKVIALYVLGALTGAVAYLIFYNFVPAFHETAIQAMASNPNFGMVGASAAVYAVVVAAAVFMPDYTFFLLFLGPVKIKYIALFYVVLSFMGSTGSNAGGNIAHLGGALIGWVYIIQLRKGTDIGSWIIGFINWIKSFFVASPKIKVTHRAEKAKKKKTKRRNVDISTADNDHDQEEIDAILDKISQSGYDSLTKEEKQKLFNASKK